MTHGIQHLPLRHECPLILPSSPSVCSYHTVLGTVACVSPSASTDQLTCLLLRGMGWFLGASHFSSLPGVPCTVVGMELKVTPVAKPQQSYLEK